MVSLGPKVSYATTKLSYPIFAAEFDPYNRGYLVVGGGGGENRSGVPNQISVLDVSNRATITPVADIELSRDEDSVQSLGSLATKDGLITFAGINSSQQDQNAGANEHFRAFDIKIPPRKRQKTGSTDVVEKGHGMLVGTRSLFKPERSPKKEAYQRILRLSPAQIKEAGSKRIGAIASAMSKPSEVVVFSATAALPAPTDIITRIEVENNDEAADLDIAVSDQNRFSIAWCTDYEICEQTLQYDFSTKKVQKTPKGPRRIHQVPIAEGTGASQPRAKFRCLRFLNHENVLALINKPGKSGTEFHIYHLYPTGPAITTMQMTLPSHIKQAVSMDVCALDADEAGNRQYIIAVAGQDISIETYVLNFRAASDTFSGFHAFQTFRDVHQQSITKICFSPFHTPNSTETSSKPQEQFVRLASVSLANTVVVDSFPLTVLQKKKNSRSRHVLVSPHAQKQQQYIFIALISLMVLVAAYVGRAYFTGEADIRTDLHNFWQDTYSEVFAVSASASDLASQMQASASSFVNEAVTVPTSVRTVIEAATTAVENVLPSSVPGQEVVSEAQETMASLASSILPTAVPGLGSLQELLDSHGEEKKAVIISEHPDSADLSYHVHDDKEAYVASNPDAVHWDELQDAQKHYWRHKLIQAGQWAEHEGEVVLKGVLWSQYAGIVGDVAGEVLREL